MLKGAIFDLDGVLVNTVPLHFKAWEKMFAGYGKSFTFQDYKKKVDGIPRLDGARAILKDFSVQQLEKATHEKQEYFLEFLEREGVEVFKDTLNLIKELKANNIKVAVISSSKNCLSVLKKANIYNLFDVIIPGGEVKKGKPNPGVFLLACKKLNFLPSECIVFEDSVLGIEAARRGNFKCVGIDRYRDPQRLAKADLIINKVSEIDVDKLEELL